MFSFWRRLTVIALFFASLVFAQQNPSPMADQTRAHKRVPQQKYPGLEFKIFDLLPQPVGVFIPQKRQKAKAFDLLLHFHGASYVVHHAAAKYQGALVAATIHLGAGSSVYGNAFDDSTRFQSLVAAIHDSLKQKLARSFSLQKIILSGFSAGYGAIRKIISSQQNFEAVEAILLLDGIHADYVPERRVLAEGGRLDSSDVAAFIRFARAAAQKNAGKQFLITHSEIFPGTFVSTTEATDFVLQNLGMKRQAVLRWGPLGMQQLSAARQHHFSVLGFAGNTAPDHVDHFHALDYFLNKLKKL